MIKMRIGYFVSEFPYQENATKDFITYSSYGGSVNVAYYLALYMANRNNAVKVFTRSAKNVGDATNKHGNLIVYRYNTNFGSANYSISINLLFKPLKHEVDIIHIHSGGTPFCVLSGLLYVKRYKKPLVVTYHGDFYVHGGIIRRMTICLYNKLQELLLQCANIIISPSRRYISTSKILYKYKEKTIVIPNGIDLPKYQISFNKEECKKILNIPLNKKVLLFIGGLHAKKGPDVLLRAALYVIKSIKDVIIIIAGEGTMREDLILLSKKLSITKYVNFIGFVEEGLKPIYFRAADIFILPSLEECFPIVNLEAMASGSTIIASNIGGIPEAIKDSENGMLVPSNDPEALAGVIMKLLSNNKLREKLGKNARQESQKYSWEKITVKTEKIYQMIISDGRNKGIYKQYFTKDKI